MQGHPEYNEYFQAGAQFRSSKVEIPDGYEKFEDDFISKNYEKSVSQRELLTTCYNFVKK